MNKIQSDWEIAYIAKVVNKLPPVCKGRDSKNRTCKMVRLSMKFIGELLSSEKAKAATDTAKQLIREIGDEYEVKKN